MNITNATASASAIATAVRLHREAMAAQKDTCFRRQNGHGGLCASWSVPPAVGEKIAAAQAAIRKIPLADLAEFRRQVR